MAQNTRLPEWLTEAHGLFGMLGALRDHVQISVSIAPVLPKSFWVVLNHAPNSVVELGSEFGRSLERDLYNVDNLRWVRENKKSRVTELGIFADLTVPVVRGDRVESALCCGPFLLRELSADALYDEWQALTDRRPSSVDLPFQRYSRQVLRLPILRPNELRAFRELIELLAQALVGSGPLGRRVSSMRKLRAELARLPSSLELKASRLIDPIENRHWKNNSFYSWELEELPIVNMPNAVVAVQPRDAGRVEVVAALASALRFRRRCLEFSRELPDALVAPFEQHGAYFLVHVDSKLSRPKWRGRLRGLVERIAEFSRRELGAAPAIGVGALGGRGEDLPAMARESGLAAGLCAHRRELCVFFDDLEVGSAERRTSARPADSALKLRRLFRETDFAALPPTLSEFVEAVLEDSAGRIAVARATVEPLLLELSELSHERAGSEQRTRADDQKRLVQALDAASSVVDVLAVLRDEMGELERLTDAPRAATADLKLDRVARFVAENCQSPLSLRDVARQAGLSPNYFSAVFKRTYGMGFAEYLIQRRIELAKKLLRAGVLSAERVAEECGFASVPHFFRAFKQRVGQTPGGYRRARAARPDPVDQSLSELA